ncbi:MAG: hypothetical protein RR177_01360, partial [Oscillospiraceae bacterium]
MLQIKKLQKGIFSSFLAIVMLLSTVFTTIGAPTAVSENEILLAHYPDGNTLKVGELQTFPFSVAKDGIYEISIVYEVQTDKAITPQMGYALDDEYRKNADNMTDMPFKWQNDMDTERFRTDKSGNELLPLQVAVDGWQRKRLPIQNSVEGGKNVLRLSNGEHTLSLCMLRESIKIQDIFLVETDNLISSKDY